MSRRRLQGPALLLGAALTTTAVPAPLRAAEEPLRQAAALSAMAPLAGSARLRLRARGDAMALGRITRPAFDAFRADMQAEGFDGTGPVQRSLSLSPVLAWDDNINGGMPEDRLWIGDWLFRADPALKARAGLVAGVATSGTLRMAWDEGRSLSLSAATEVAWSPRHHLGRADLLIRGCALNQLQGWTFLDACVTGQRSFRQRSIQNQADLSLTLHHILPAARGLHDLSLGGSLIRPDGGPAQPRITLAGESLWSFGATDLALTLGRPREGETLLQQRVSAGLTLLPMGRPLRIDLSRERSGGGFFAGIARQDRITSLRLSAPVTGSVTARFGYSAARSTVSIAQYNRVSFELRFANPLRS